jgi:hypothetical protein
MNNNIQENKKKSIFSERRFKYGSFAVGLTVAFIALVIAVNAVVYALAYSYGWYIDLTGEQYYGITDKSTKYLDEVLTDGVEVKIIFCKDKDLVIEDSAGYYVYRCVETYKKAYPNNIKVEYLDVIEHPELAEIYTTQLGIPLYTYNVIIETNISPNKRVLTYENFFTFDQDTGNVYAFNGERRFTSYIISVCSDYPICYFLTGHGESVGTSEKRNAIWELMVDAGFDVRTLDLTMEDASLDDAKAVVINDPVYDFKGEEIEQIGRFMADKGGNMMVFLSPQNQGNLTTLKNWLGEWGVSVEDGQIKDTAHSLTPDGLSVIADYPIEGFAASLHDSLRALDSQPSTVIRNPLSFKALWSESGSKRVGDVLYAYTGAELLTTEGSVTSRQLSLAALVQNTRIDYITQSELKSYLLVTSAGYVDEAFLNSNAYGNRDIIFSLINQMGKKLVPIDIDFKVFASEALDIPIVEAYAWTVTLVGVFPALICVAGGVVCYRRKRK